jgi:hypothetical protein
VIFLVERGERGGRTGGVGGWEFPLLEWGEGRDSKECVWYKKQLAIANPSCETYYIM